MSVPRIARFLAVILATAALAGCASTGAADREPYATLIVENDNTMAVNVFALRGATRTRLGTVTGLGQEEFSLRIGMLSGGNQLRLLIAPIGSPIDYPSQSIMVYEGDVLELRVSSFLR